MAAVFWLAKKPLIKVRSVFKLTWRANPFLLFLVLIVLGLLGSSAFAQFGYRTQFYVWEFPIDLKSTFLGILCYYFRKKIQEEFVFAKIGLDRWDWGANLLAFFSPLVLLTLLIIAGYFFKTILYRGVENSAAFLLATLFDIPAIYFFSITTILLEEIIFRGFILNAISKKENIFIASLLASGLWALMSFSSVFQKADLSLTSILLGYMELISLGFACSALFFSTRSIWSSYSYRIGFMVFSAALLSEGRSETNSLFRANSATFSSSKILVIFMNFIFAVFLINLQKNNQKTSHS